VEVKATAGREGRKVRIHGVDQLEEPPDGPLFLAWIRLVEDPDKGLTMRQMIAAVRDQCGDPAELDRRLVQLGVPIRGADEFDQRAFIAVEERWHRVEPDFPRIVPGGLVGGAVPGGVLDLEYTVDLDTVLSSAIVQPDLAIAAVGCTS
jgi:hypothetical protein